MLYMPSPIHKRLPVSVVIVNYNKATYTRLCLESMLSVRDVPGQVIAIDNGSADDTLAYLEDELPGLAEAAGVECQVIANPANAGACTARNQGLARVSQPYIVFIDNDVAVRSADWLRILQETLESADDIGVVGPKLVYPFEPYAIQCAGVGISRTGRVQYRGRGAVIDALEFNQPREAQCLISACWLMRRAVVEQVGNLDEVFNPAQFEDFDLCYRARERGWRVMYEPAAVMYHYESVTTAGSQGVNYKYITIKNGLEFKRRWQHLFEHEDGPEDAACSWAKMETRPFEMTGVPPIA